MTTPQTNRAGDTGRALPMDRCQTPPYAVTPLLPYLRQEWRIWESAAGEGMLAGALRTSGFDVIESDLLTGQNFFERQPDSWDVQVTNPPYSVKYKWLARSYALGKPFALLVPGDTLFAKSAQTVIKRYGFEAILFDSRVDFKMPNKGWDGSSAQFAVIWLTWGLNIGQQMTFAHLDKPNAQRRHEHAAGVVQLALLTDIAP